MGCQTGYAPTRPSAAGAWPRATYVDQVLREIGAPTDRRYSNTSAVVHHSAGKMRGVGAGEGVCSVIEVESTVCGTSAVLGGREPRIVLGIDLSTCVSATGDHGLGEDRRLDAQLRELGERRGYAGCWHFDLHFKARSDVFEGLAEGSSGAFCRFRPQPGT
jgi:hypothetical protein